MKVLMRKMVILLLVAATMGACTQPTPSLSRDGLISLSPAIGDYLTDSQNVPSEVMLEESLVVQSISDQQYANPWYPAKTISQGSPILVVSGTIQSKNRGYCEIGLYAEGYDAAGKQVSWTLDASGIAGQVGLSLEYGQTTEFTLHLNMASNIKAVRIFATPYSKASP